VLNKMDLPSADPSRRRRDRGRDRIDADDAIRASAKTAWASTRSRGGDRRIPPPGRSGRAAAGADIDSWFDNYVGVVMLVRVVNGRLAPRDKIRMMATGATHLVEQVACSRRSPRSATACRRTGRFVISGVKDLQDAKVATR